MASRDDSSRCKLTPAVLRGIVRAVRAGIPYRFAAPAVGITPRTLYRWLKAGRSRRGRGPQAELMRELCRKCHQAQAAAVADRVRRIGKAGKTNWKADAWWLERVFPADFGPDRDELAALRKEVARLADQIRGTGEGGHAAANGPPAGPPARAAGDRPGR